MHNILVRKLLLIGLVTCLASCTQLIFHPVENHRFDISKKGIAYEDVDFRSADGTSLHGWWFPNIAADYKSTIVFLHGNAGNVSYHFENAYWLSKYGYDVFLFDYRGFGYSEGEEQLTGVLKDIEAAFLYAGSRSNDNKFIVIGQSLGASLGVKAVADSSYKENIQLIALVSGFSDYRKIAREILSKSWVTWAFQWPLSLTINNDASPIMSIYNISPIPVGIFYSKQDEIISYQHGLDLYRYAKEPKQVIELNKMHNQILLDQSNRGLLLEYLELTLKELRE